MLTLVAIILININASDIPTTNHASKAIDSVTSQRRIRPVCEHAYEEYDPMGNCDAK